MTGSPLVAVSALAAAGCLVWPSPSEPPVDPLGEPSPGGAAHAPTAAATRAQSGTLEGVVRWSGTSIPESTRVRNSTDPEICGPVHTLEDLVISEKDAGIENVIVALVDPPEDPLPSRAPGRLVIENVGCRFRPHAAVLTVGSTIETTNLDETLHTTHLYGALEINLALPLAGMRVSRTVDRPGMIVVKCDVHGWMSAYVRVDEHPFHAVTRASGAFRLPNVPAGDYVVEAWHERLGTQRRTVRVGAGRTARLEIDFGDEGPSAASLGAAPGSTHDVDHGLLAPWDGRR